MASVSDVSHPESAPAFPPGGGEMGALIREIDWSKTPLGAIDTWSLALRMMVSFLLANRFPLLLWWGAQYVQIYNDAYRPIPGTKHPKAMGQPASACWPEIWHILKPLIDTPFHGGPATWMDDFPLEVHRHGFTEETHFTVAYSPVPDESVASGIGGVLATVHEITEKVVGERRVVVLRDLAARASDAKSAEEACVAAAGVLSHHPKDLPFALIYVLDADRREARLAAAAGVGFGEPVSPAIVPLEADAAAPWPLAEATRRRDIVVVDDLASRFARIPPGPWSDPPASAVVIPVRASKAEELAGFIVAGVSPRLRLDENYRSFFELVAVQIASCIANASAYEEERKRAESLAEIDRAKTAFFSNISHEFRTPLTLMLGPIDDVLNDPENGIDAQQRDRITMVQRNALRLQKLVNALLDFSRVEAGRIQAVYQPTDLAALTGELASSFRSACEKAGLALNIAAEPLPDVVLVDREMWEKIVLNLVSNAFKFTFEGRIDVAVRAEAGRAVLRVSDTGIGIADAELPFVFERFHRVDGARGRTHEGTGIGLALVQELVKLHGGQITVESTVGRGTTFAVALPFGSAHLPADRIDVARDQPSTAVRAEAFVSESLRWLPDGILADPSDHGEAAAQSAPRAGARILLAEDNADMRGYLYRLLAARYAVTAVADGEEAFRAAKHVRPDLVLTDVMMPRLDGFGLLARLRADAELCDVPVVILSARAGEEAKSDGMRSGADDYLIKPFGARELLARVEAHLKMAQLRREVNDALRCRTAQFKTLLDQAPVGVFLVDADFRVLEINPIALPQFQDVPGGLIGRDLRELMSLIWEKQYADQVMHIFQQTLASGEPFTASEWSGVRADRKRTEFYEWKLDRIVLPDGRFGLVCYFRDISERIMAESTRQLLLKELSHRVKNTLATVQAIAQQTLRRTKEPRDFAGKFSGRIQSLARVHSLLTDTNWQGADLQGLIRDQLLQGAADEARLTAWGPAVQLAPQAAIHIALMLHELGTNSAKYGALSAAGGFVTVSWSVKDGQLALRWVERGGPTVSAPFAAGFGTTLIEQSAKSEGGRAQMLCEAQGVTWDITLPLPHVEAANAPAPAAAPSLRPPQADADVGSVGLALRGRRILVVEDEPLIALDLADTLEKAGAKVTGPVGTASEALQVIEDGEFDGALLDANLHGRSVDEMAAALTRRNIPFIFVTGYGEVGLRTAFKHAPVLGKPVTERQLIDKLLTMQPRGDGVVRLRSP